MGKRIYAQREWRLLSWWLATFHPNAEILMNVRVGPIYDLITGPPQTYAEAQASRVRNRWADAIYLESGTVNIVEASMQPELGLISEVQGYSHLFSIDPVFREWWALPRREQIVVYRDDPYMADRAAAAGVAWIVYTPNLVGFVPPTLAGTLTASLGASLPQDWPARTFWPTGIKLSLGGGNF